MSIHHAIDAARAHREEIIFGALTGLLSCPNAPLNVPLPRIAGSSGPDLATHFGETIPQDAPTLLHLLDRCERGVEESGEFDYPTGSLLVQLGSSFRRHGLGATHYASLSEAILASIDRHIPDADGVASLKDAVELACSLLAHGAAEATENEIGAKARGEEINPPTARAKVVDVELRNPTMKVVRMHMDPPLRYAVGEALLARTPYTPMVWRPVYAALPANPDGLIEIHVSCGAGKTQHGDHLSNDFLRTVVSHAQIGDTWVLSPEPRDEDGRPYGLHLDDSQFSAETNRPILMIAESVGLAPVRAAILQQVMGGVIGATPDAAPEDVRPNGTAPTMRNVQLFWGAHNPGELYELEGMMGLKNAFDWLRVVPVANQLHTPEDSRPLPQYEVGSGNPEGSLSADDPEHAGHATLDSSVEEHPSDEVTRQIVQGDVVDVALRQARKIEEKTVIIAGSPEMISRASRELVERHNLAPQQIIELPLRFM
ncbi:hypothetical protein [Corynebacterium anserum]|uniref:Uncharacterized protein n=1 Tax=Corynebacterium anserum TaxID=2684406 RepID=A0A7G7YLT1_9CORY|nr:hypothetical protein [Corynebacterium anserum]MBC2681384.1 hypothetical protein [Corynebacterium anserum]QNH95451.1 hypothetical protein GP473_00905 [Corynebacterium anserum]